SELQDLRSIFKLYFELGGEEITSSTGETLIYQSKQSFGYDFEKIKDILDEIGALKKAIKLNNAFVDRLVAGHALEDDKREIVKEARQEIIETKNIQVIKVGK
ncbi:hypothetical protein IJV79_00675, partial [bacterium]|nr:hypothetical protein [bacterium]